jgi:hypothetical protein
MMEGEEIRGGEITPERRLNVSEDKGNGKGSPGDVKVDREAIVEELKGEIGRIDDAMKETKAQLVDLEQGVKEMDVLLSGQLDELWVGLPDTTPKGVLDQVLKLSTPKRGQLLENIDKLKISLQGLASKRTKAYGEIIRLEKQIQEERINGLAKELLGKVEGWAESYREAEAVFYSLAQDVARLYSLDPAWGTRTEKLGYPAAFAIVAQDILKFTRMADFTMEVFASEVAARTHRSAGNERLLQKDSHRAKDNRPKSVIRPLMGPSPFIGE